MIAAGPCCLWVYQKIYEIFWQLLQQPAEKEQEFEATRSTQVTTPFLNLSAMTKGFGLVSLGTALNFSSVEIGSNAAGVSFPAQKNEALSAFEMVSEAPRLPWPSMPQWRLGRQISDFVSASSTSQNAKETQMAAKPVDEKFGLPVKGLAIAVSLGLVLSRIAPLLMLFGSIFTEKMILILTARPQPSPPRRFEVIEGGKKD